MITISECTCNINNESGLVNLVQFDHNIQMITISVITLSGAHCVLMKLRERERGVLGRGGGEDKENMVECLQMKYGFK
jgi:hypothetical protein